MPPFDFYPWPGDSERRNGDPRYSVPSQGWREASRARIHFIGGAEGFTPVVTHRFIEGSRYLDDDAVFGVKKSLIVRSPVSLVRDVLATPVTPRAWRGEATSH